MGILGKRHLPLDNASATSREGREKDRSVGGDSGMWTVQLSSMSPCRVGGVGSIVVDVLVQDANVELSAAIECRCCAVPAWVRGLHTHSELNSQDRARCRMDL